MSALSVLSEPSAAPAMHFLVGQDRDGHWVALETHGLGGGVFRSREDALHYAVGQTFRRADGVTVSEERIELRI